MAAAAATTAQAFRKLVRNGKYTTHTCGLGIELGRYAQANLVTLPSKEAKDFHQFCELNPKPCPLLEMTEVGSPYLNQMGEGIDLRSDLPSYRIFKHGKLVEETDNVKSYYDKRDNDLVGFVLGCSFSFEQAILDAGLPVRHIEQNLNVPMYRTNQPCKSSGMFEGPLVVSMRPYKMDEIDQVVEITKRYPRVHGDPIHIGSPEKIGININKKPDWGDEIELASDDIPVFWACGVTPQAVVLESRPEFCITHSPGHMLVLDIENEALASSTH